MYLPPSHFWIQASYSSLEPAWWICPGISLQYGTGTQYGCGCGGFPFNEVEHLTLLVTWTWYSKHKPALDATGGP